MNSPRSRRVVLALGALAFGLSACGDPSTSNSTSGSQTTIAAAQTPPKIKIAGAAGGVLSASASASAEASPAGDSALGTSRMFAPSITYVFDGDAPTFDTPAGAWYFPVGVAATDEQLRALGAAFGFTDAPQPVPADQGGGWVFGVNDGTGAGLQISASATLDWWFYPDPTTFRPVEGCAVAAVEPAIEPAVEPATDIAVGELLPVPDAACGEPTPPAGVPSEADALDKARELFTAIGLDLSKYELSATGDEWGRNVTVTQMLDGHRSPVAQSVGFGENGSLTWAGGVLAEPVPGADYPRVSVADAVQRLNDQSTGWGPMVRGAVIDTPADAEGPIVGDAGGATIEPALGAPEPAITIAPPVCIDPAVIVASPGLEATSEGVAPDAASSGGSGVGGDTPTAPPDAPADPALAVESPVDGIIDPGFGCGEFTPPEPITVHLNGVAEGLTMVWATDNTVWLLPAYDFTDADGGQYQINAVADDFIENVPVEAEPVPAPETVPAPEPLPNGTVAPSPTPAPTPAPPAEAPPAEAPTVDSAAVLVGLTEAEAADTAAANGWILRVAQLDGEPLAVTADFVTNRVNVAVDAGKVSAVLGFG